MSEVGKRTSERYKVRGTKGNSESPINSPCVSNPVILTILLTGFLSVAADKETLVGCYVQIFVVLYKRVPRTPGVLFIRHPKII